MTSRERVLLALSHREADRVAIHDSPWFTTVRRWHKEGLPKDMSPEEYFGYEFRSFGADLTMQLPREVIEETDEYTITRTSDGSVLKNWKNATSTPERIDYLIKDRKTWEELKPRMVMNDTRVDWEKDLKRNKEIYEQGWFVTFGAAVGYDRTQGLVSSERLLMAMIDDPEWVKDMFSTVAQLTIDAADEMISRGFKFDAAFLFDDMGYRNTSLFSPQMYRELSMPYHKSMCDFFKSKGMPIILHSCGCVKGLIPDLIKAGFTCLQPLEVKAGMDLIELKKKYGDALAFMGGIDVRKMASDNPKDIEEEVRTKVAFAKKGGGYIYHSDHSVPDNVSFENYKRTIELVREYGRYD